MAEDFPEIMTLVETCRYLRIPRTSLYKLAQEGRIPCQKVGKQWRFRKQALEQWLSELGRHAAGGETHSNERK